MEGTNLNGYELSKRWFDFAFENPELISPNHSAIYFFAIEHHNRMGWKTKFGFPSQMVMDAIGIKKHSTYIRYFNDLVSFGFFILIEKSSNQYSANIISFNSDMPKSGKALSKAITNQGEKQIQSIGQSKRSIDKLRTKNLKLKKEKEKEKIVFPFNSETFKSNWNSWKDYKSKEFRFNYKSVQSEQAAINKLKEISNGDEKEAIKIIEQSFANGWKGFFKIINETQQSKIKLGSKTYMDDTVDEF